jgi:hypothetical protein
MVFFFFFSLFPLRPLVESGRGSACTKEGGRMDRVCLCDGDLKQMWAFHWV